MIELQAVLLAMQQLDNALAAFNAQPDTDLVDSSRSVLQCTHQTIGKVRLRQGSPAHPYTAAEAAAELGVEL